MNSEAQGGANAGVVIMAMNTLKTGQSRDTNTANGRLPGRWCTAFRRSAAMITIAAGEWRSRGLPAPDDMV